MRGRALLLASFLAACSHPPPPAAPDAPPPEPEPVKEVAPPPVDPPPPPPAPMTGKVSGKPFTAKSALAFPDKDEPGTMMVKIFDAALTCADMGKPASSEMLFVDFPIPWEKGKSGDPEDVRFNAVKKGGKPRFVDGKSGKIEVLWLKDPGGRVRVEAKANAKNDVTGEVDVVVCK